MCKARALILVVSLAQKNILILEFSKIDFSKDIYSLEAKVSQSDKFDNLCPSYIYMLLQACAYMHVQAHIHVIHSDIRFQDFDCLFIQ